MSSSTCPSYQDDPKNAIIKREVGDAEKDLIPVRCGKLNGFLHFKLFVCPGIHENCISVENEETTLISPKEFTIKAEKDKQKDWRGSIRVGTSTLRLMLDSGTLDFYDHPMNCSSKCASRNFINANHNGRPSKEDRKASSSSSSSSSYSFPNVVQPPRNVEASVSVGALMSPPSSKKSLSTVEQLLNQMKSGIVFAQTSSSLVVTPTPKPVFPGFSPLPAADLSTVIDNMIGKLEALRQRSLICAASQDQKQYEQMTAKTSRALIELSRHIDTLEPRPPKQMVDYELIRALVSIARQSPSENVAPGRKRAADEQLTPDGKPLPKRLVSLPQMEELLREPPLKESRPMSNMELLISNANSRIVKMEQDVKQELPEDH